MDKENISEYYLERYILGELPEDEREEIRRLASKKPELQAALNEMKSSNRKILELYPPHTIKANLLTQLSKTSKKPHSWKITFTICSAAAALLILFLIFPVIRHKSVGLFSGSEKEVTLVKGIPRVNLFQTQLLVYRKIQDQVELLKDGETARAGDLLQLAYVSAEETYGIILSVDGKGLLTLHYPENRGESNKLEKNKQFLLPNAIELDNAPDFERFFFLISENPFNVERVMQRVRNAAKNLEKIKEQDLDLPENFIQYSVLILKGEGL